MSPQIWTVRAFETPSRRRRVTATRYHVIATSADEAIAIVRVEHEHPDMPETKGTRYVAVAYGGAVQRVDIRFMQAAEVDATIEAGLA